MVFKEVTSCPLYLFLRWETVPIITLGKWLQTCFATYSKAGPTMFWTCLNKIKPRGNFSQSQEHNRLVVMFCFQLKTKLTSVDRCQFAFHFQLQIKWLKMVGTMLMCIQLNMFLAVQRQNRLVWLLVKCLVNVITYMYVHYHDRKYCEHLLNN